MPRALVLVHSPVLHSGAWEPVATELRPDHNVIVPSLMAALDGPAPYWQKQAALVVQEVDGEAGRIVLIGHSGSGPLLGLIGARVTVPIDAYIFVDAGIPIEGSWFASAPAEMTDQLRARAVDGMLPKWSDWWNDSDLAAEIPDGKQRQDLVDHLGPLPLAMFEETRPEVDGWPDAPCGYLRLSDGYDREAAKAASLGWPVEIMQSTHLGIITEPAAVADGIRVLLSKLQMA